MICKSCEFENKEGAAFCAKCGKPLNEPEKPETEAIKPTEDDSEANTSVLTSDMLTPPKKPEPQQVNPMPQKINPMPQQGFVPGPNGAPKPQKPVKSGKQGTAAKVYIVVSIILIVAMAGAGVWLFLHFNGKIDDISKEKDSLASQMDASSSNYESQISDKDTAIAELETQIADIETQIEDYESEIADYESASESYAAYDNLIQFAAGSAGQGYSDFFASDTVLHLTGGEVAVMVYFGIQEDSNVIYTVADTSVASCEWGDSWNGDVATLYVSPNGSGNTVITLSNDINDETINIYVYVD